MEGKIGTNTVAVAHSVPAFFRFVRNEILISKLTTQQKKDAEKERWRLWFRSHS
jgi:hypothetical protein